MTEHLWYGDDPAARAGRALLAPLSMVFGAAAAARGALYDRHLLPVVDVGVPVISVGGLTVGGAGKTPFVLWLVGQLRSLGLSPCVLTRGYGGTARAALLLTEAQAPWPAELVAAAGDEAVMIAARSGVPVAVAAERAAGARLARERLDPDIFVLDDGFQHRPLARDLDIVLVTGNESRLRLLPAGPLRERPGALLRADVVVTTARAGLPLPGNSPALPLSGGYAAVPLSGTGAQSAVAAAVRAPLTLSMRLEPTALLPSRAGAGGWCASPQEPDATAAPQIAAAGDSLPLPRQACFWDLRPLAGLRVGAVAAIARPERFRATLEAAGAVVVETLFLRDHHAYDASDWGRIADLARRCEKVVTTEKDMVKLAAFADGADWLAALRIEARVEGEGALLERLAVFDRKRGPTHHPRSRGGSARR